MYPFGSGLSYTTFALGDVDIAATPDAVTVSGTVANTGARDGADVVQVYAQLPDPGAPDRLVGFARVEVAAGSSAGFTIGVARDRLATRDPEAHAWRPASGPHRLVVGRFAGDPDATVATVEL
jgi:beta-glucosidase